MGRLDTLRTWSARRWAVAGVSALAALLVLGLPTDVIANPIFGRQGTPVPVWSYPVLVVSAVLSGLLLATYVRQPDELDRPGRIGGLGGALSFFAIGCPVCNKLIVIGLGTTGALNLFAPIQPLLAVVALGFLGWAFQRRLQGDVACTTSRTVPS